jgi:hypothetical protein
LAGFFSALFPVLASKLIRAQIGATPKQRMKRVIESFNRTSYADLK